VRASVAGFPVSSGPFVITEHVIGPLSIVEIGGLEYPKRVKHPLVMSGFTPYQPPQPPEPPHPSHAHSPHKEAHLQAHPVDVTTAKYNELVASERTRARFNAIKEHPIWAGVLTLSAFAPSSYIGFALTRDFGWWILFPPLPLAVGGIIWVILALIFTTPFLLAKWTIGETGQRMAKWFEAAGDVVGYGVAAGLFLGIVAWVVTKIL